MLNETFHYPPDLFNLLVDTIPLINKGKQDVILFFEGAGTPNSIMDEMNDLFQKDRVAVKKHTVTKAILTELNRMQDQAIGVRREVLKRVIEFENFSACWPEERDKAKLSVIEVRELVGTKDSFTRMNIERENERKERMRTAEEERALKTQKLADLAGLRQQLFALFPVTDPQSRGKALERILNRLFETEGLLVREDFVTRNEKGVAIEQIDGAIQMDGQIYLVEMKWHSSNIGVDMTAQHLVRIISRADARGILISSSKFTVGAIQQVKDALSQRVFILIELEEIVTLLEKEIPFADVLRKKVQSAMLDRNPLHRPIGFSL